MPPDDEVGPAERWVDSHCHLPSAPAEADAVADAARAQLVEWMVCVGTDLATSRAAVAIAERRADVVATVGLHPHDAVRLDEDWSELVALAAHPQVVAVGEAGFDHHYEHSPGPDQAAAFRAQVRLAHELDRTLVIHTREAWDETFAVLDDEGVPARTVFHCFTGGPTEAEACLARGATLSFSGIVTFKNADEVRAAAAMTPADRMLVETDSPFLAPVPHRGQPNRPAWIGAVGAGLAAARAEPLKTVADATRVNAARLFLPA
jgi:TatD DNase family protein